MFISQISPGIPNKEQDKQVVFRLSDEAIELTLFHHFGEADGGTLCNGVTVSSFFKCPAGSTAKLLGTFEDFWSSWNFSRLFCGLQIPSVYVLPESTPNGCSLLSFWYLEPVLEALLVASSAASGLFWSQPPENCLAKATKDT